MDEIIIYASFLIRLSATRAKVGPVVDDWQGELQHIQSGQRWRFATLDDLLAFLRLYTAECSAAESPGQAQEGEEA
ncbi:MAG: hypothetical protein DYG89_01190 [Caldilinea sp. CFX5]|nr:hypothetical protein [Caldilinea sp. CFX5]